MSWNRITLPLEYDIKDAVDPRVVEIGNIGWACYDKANRPAGFAMFHAARGTDNYTHTFVIYLSPLTSELCKEEIEKASENYKLVPCEAPFRDEPYVSFVFGDPLVMGWLRDKYEPELDEVPQASAPPPESSSAAGSTA